MYYQKIWIFFSCNTNKKFKSSDNTFQVSSNSSRELKKNSLSFENTSIDNIVGIRFSSSKVNKNDSFTITDKVLYTDSPQTQYKSTNFSTDDSETDSPKPSTLNSKNATKTSLFKLQAEIKEEIKEDTLDTFEKIKIIGRGTFGKVVLGKHKKENKLYAIKCLKKSTYNQN